MKLLAILAAVGIGLYLLKQQEAAAAATAALNAKFASRIQSGLYRPDLGTKADTRSENIFEQMGWRFWL